MPSRSERNASSTALLLLADAAPEIGAGHAMRCAALAAAWRDEQLGSVAFSGRVTIPFVLAKLRAAGAEMITHGAPHEPRRVIVVDSYDHKRRQQALEMSGTLRIVVDDLVEAVPVGFDVIWNPNAYANSSMYPTFPGHVVSGPDAVPLRGELPVWHLPATRSIGVSLGGGVLPAVLRAAVEELPSRYPGWRFCAVGSWEHPALRDIPADEPWRELVACDRLLISAGTTAWEAAAVGSPVALVQTAPNQARILDWARRAGVPGVTVAEAVGEKNLAARLGEALMSAARLPGIRNGASLVARTFARFAGHRMASL